MSARWLFDLGNTRLKCAPLHGDGRIGEMIALSHHGSDGKDDDGGGDEDRIAATLSAASVTGEVAYVASVAAPGATVAFFDALTRRFTRISIARTQATFADIRIAYYDPSALGVDRFLALLGARTRGRQATLVVGVGTALTIDLIDADGRHRGGRIAPSPALMRDALHQRAVQLPTSGGTYVEFAVDTIGALASGCEGAALSLIERSIAEATHIIGAVPTLLLHGGGAPALLPYLARAESVPALVLEGLAQWAAVEESMRAEDP